MLASCGHCWHHLLYQHRLFYKNSKRKKKHNYNDFRTLENIDKLITFEVHCQSYNTSLQQLKQNNTHGQIN